MDMVVYCDPEPAMGESTGRGGEEAGVVVGVREGRREGGWEGGVGRKRSRISSDNILLRMSVS